jgi:hypothetical protein
MIGNGRMKKQNSKGEETICLIKAITLDKLHDTRTSFCTISLWRHKICVKLWVTNDDN